MKVDEISRDSEEARLRVQVQPEEMDKAFAIGLDTFVAQYELQDASGETSIDKIKNTLDEDAAKNAINFAVVNYLLSFALSERGIVPLASYDFAWSVDPQAGKEFVFEMTALLNPHYELSDYGCLTVQVDAKPEVQDEDIEEQMRMLARQFCAWEQGIDVNSPELTAPDVTDAWVEERMGSNGIHTVADLREKFRETSEQELAERYEQAKMAAAMNEYIGRVQGELTEKMIDAMTSELFEAFLAELAQDGMTFEEFSLQQGMSEDDVRDTLAVQAKNQLMQGLVLDAIFEHEGLELTPPDLQVALRNAAPGQEEDYLESLQKYGRTELLKQAAKRMKAASWIMDNTTFIAN